MFPYSNLLNIHRFSFNSSFTTTSSYIPSMFATTIFSFGTITEVFPTLLTTSILLSPLFDIYQCLFWVQVVILKPFITIDPPTISFVVFSNHWYLYARVHIYIYIYLCVCVCVLEFFFPPLFLSIFILKWQPINSHDIYWYWFDKYHSL